MMKTRAIIASLAVIIIFTQCSTSVPIGYYYENKDNYKPSYSFYYDDRVHFCQGLVYDETVTKNMGDTLNYVFIHREKIKPFFDKKNGIDTLKLTVEYSSSIAPKYHFIFTPSRCKFYVYGPDRLMGTYEFVPNRSEKGLISFASSKLEYDNKMLVFLSFNEANNNSVIFEPAFCSVQVKTKKTNATILTHLFADEVPDALFFLVDAIQTLIYDYCTPSYKTDEEPCEKIMDDFDTKVDEKYKIPPLPTDS